MAGTKTLRVGVLTPVATLDPQEAQDFVSALAVLQVYETPFSQPRAAGVAVPGGGQPLCEDLPGGGDAAALGVRGDLGLEDIGDGLKGQGIGAQRHPDMGGGVEGDD